MSSCKATFARKSQPASGTKPLVRVLNMLRQGAGHEWGTFKKSNLENPASMRVPAHVLKDACRQITRKYGPSGPFFFSTRHSTRQPNGWSRKAALASSASVGCSGARHRSSPFGVAPGGPHSLRRAALPYRRIRIASARHARSSTS